MKKKIFIPVIVILILLVLVFLFSSFINNSRFVKKNYKSVTIDEEAIIYLVDDIKKYPQIQYTDAVINYFKDVYQVPIITVNIKEIGEDNYEKLLDDLRINKDNILPPALLFKKGELTDFITNFYLESSLKDMLIQYGFKTEDELGYDVSIVNEIFDEIYLSDDNSLVYICTHSKDYYNRREFLYHLAVKNDFMFYINIIGESGTDKMVNAFMKILNQNVGYDVIAIVCNNEIKDYQIVKKDSDIEEFLKDNNYIKS